MSSNNQDTIGGGNMQQRVVQKTKKSSIVSIIECRASEHKIVHPVIIFWTRSSGKSAMMLSLLSYLSHNHPEDISIEFIEDMFPQNYPDAENRNEQARIIYEDHVTNWRNDIAPQATTTPVYPLYLPVNVTKFDKNSGNRKKTEIEFIFLESEGEWYHRDDNNNFKDFNQEIYEMLSQYSGGMSILCVSPVCGKNEPHGEREFSLDCSHECLDNAIQRYQRCRTVAGNLDNLVMLLAKWDGKYDPDYYPEQFSAPTAELIEKEVKSLRFGWGQFAGVNNSLLPVGSKGLMPYAARRFNSEGIPVSAGSHQPIFDHFNRVLWDWLYGGATRTIVNGVPQKSSLFQEVIPKKPSSRTLYDKIVAAILFLNGNFISHHA